ncbi:carbohydrate ABC transporter permease [Vallitalea guaymasensis]|uniref:Carbohydrate ABC transporter permease n=1 Tax=Vallitalea guaymasensis TaxID=1185412 RepID=A0A8J8M799_9FIRM|nr:carbohydrate ABC transporter permease [Vallitalea guaymasensis]QUH27694.1 carbohydrate ABC transporter permease [Vallitalea guaymasensis]
MKKTKKKSNRTLKKMGVYIFLIVMALVFVGPMVFTLLSSMKGNVEIFDNPFGLPEKFLISNYVTAWKEANMGTYFVNSILISVSTVAILIVVSSMVAYVLARFDFKLNKFLGIFFLLGMMIPMHTILVPVAYIIGSFNLKNNIFALILLYVAFSLPFSIFVLTSFMKGINASLEEAAIIDGAGYFQIYSRVMLPLTVPAISTVSIFNFLGAWNNVLFPLLFINNNKLKPISLGLLNFNGERGSEYGPLMAAIIITVFVPFVIYLLFQEKVESGLAAGAIKG